MTAQFLIDPSCKGVRIARYSWWESTHKKTWMEGPHWLLKVDFTPTVTSHPKQEWLMKLIAPALDADNIEPPRGEGTSSEIAAAACSIANVHGAEVQKGN
jgi:hypothetical protein